MGSSPLSMSRFLCFLPFLIILTITAPTSSVKKLLKHKKNPSHDTHHSKLKAIKNAYKLVSQSLVDIRIELIVNYTGTDDYYIKPDSFIVKTLNVSVKIYSEQEFSIKISDAKDPKRWSVPEAAPFPNDSYRKSRATPVKTYAIEFEANLFSLRVLRKSTGEVLFDTSHSSFIFSNQYIEFTTPVPTDHFFGLGDRAYKFQLSD